MENTDNNTNTFNWLAYSSDNTNNYIGYPTKKKAIKLWEVLKFPNLEDIIY